MSPTGELLAAQATESGDLGATVPDEATMVQPMIGQTRDRLSRRQAAEAQEPRAFDVPDAEAAATPVWEQVGANSEPEVPVSESAEPREEPIRRAWWVIVLRYLAFILVALVLGALIWQVASDGELTSLGTGIAPQLSVVPDPGM